MVKCPQAFKEKSFIEALAEAAGLGFFLFCRRLISHPHFGSKGQCIYIYKYVYVLCVYIFIA